MTTTHRNLILAFIALQLLDVASTMYCLKWIDGNEANPVVQLFITHLGSWWWAPKLALAFSTIPIFMNCRTRHLAAVTALCAVVVLNNIIAM